MRQVQLKSGTRMTLESRGARHELLAALVAQAVQRYRRLSASEPLDASDGWDHVFSLALMDLHFVAGQLIGAGEAWSLPALMASFDEYWESLQDVPRDGTHG